MAEEIIKKYKLKTGLFKSLVKTGIVAIPIILTALIATIPVGIKDLTIGAVLVYATNVITNWLKNK